MKRCGLLLLLLLPVNADATDAFDPTQAVPVETSTWARTERLVDASPRMIQEVFIPIVEHKLAEIVAGFDGDASPPSSQFLLHYAAGWSKATPPLSPATILPIPRS